MFSHPVVNYRLVLSPQANMFNEDEDWNDEEEAQVLSKTVVNANLKSRSSEDVKVYSILKRRLLHVQICCLYTIHIL